MNLIDAGSGPPLVLIPGIQGRWEYLRPAIDALARSFRVLTFALCGESACDIPFNPALGFDNDARHVAAVLDHRGIERAIICGISFGGLPAVRFAAMHPDRVDALVLVSTPGPRWHLRPRHRAYASIPWLFGPLFLLESPFRLRRELRATFPHMAARWRFTRWQLRTLVRAPLSPSRMAARAALIANIDMVADCAKVVAPTLIVTGERELDRVVDVDRTREYLRLIKHSRHETIEGTGHLGSITKPEEFAAIVRSFTEGPANRLRQGYGGPPTRGEDPPRAKAEAGPHVPVVGSAFRRTVGQEQHGTA